MADTPANPDRSYLCAAAATNSSGQTIGYLTVAGSVNAAAQSECSAVTQGSGWTAVASSPFHETLYTPVCFIAFDAGHLTRSVDGSIHLRPLPQAPPTGFQLHELALPRVGLRLVDLERARAGVSTPRPRTRPFDPS